MRMNHLQREVFEKEREMVVFYLLATCSEVESRCCIPLLRASRNQESAPIHHRHRGKANTDQRP
jgi:hypothetical protein